MPDANAPAASEVPAAEAAGAAAAADPASQSAAPAPAGAPADASQQPPAGEGKPAGEGDKPEGAPESYADFAAPENVVLDAPVLDEFKVAAKELNLSQDKAQALINRLGPKIAASQSKQLADTVSKAQTEWGQQARIDKEFGGDKLDANLAVAERGLNSFGTPELKALLKSSGLSHHPEVIRFCYRAGLTVSEDRHVSGGAAQGEKSAAQVLFGGTK